MARFCSVRGGLSSEVLSDSLSLVHFRLGYVNERSARGNPFGERRKDRKIVQEKKMGRKKKEGRRKIEPTVPSRATSLIPSLNDVNVCGLRNLWDGFSPYEFGYIH